MVLVAALYAGLVACTRAAQAPTHDTAADKLAIDTVRNREISAMNSGVTDSMVTVYADDIVLMPNHDAAVTRRERSGAWCASPTNVMMPGDTQVVAVDPQPR